MLDFHQTDVDIVDKIVIAVQQLGSHPVVSFSYSNGSIEFRDRTSWSIITQDDDIDKVANLTQVGFVLPQGEACKSQAVNPTFREH